MLQHQIYEELRRHQGIFDQGCFVHIFPIRNKQANYNKMKSNIKDNDHKITVDMLEQMKDLRVTDGKIDDIINSEKGSRFAGEALYFLGSDWINKNFK